MTLKLSGLKDTLAVLKNDLDAETDKLVARVQSARTRGMNAFKSAHGILDEAESAVKEVEDFAKSLEGSNGGPPLDGASGSVTPSTAAAVNQSQPVEPAASWSGAGPKPAGP